MTKHTHDRTFFNVLNKSSCYWAGFLAADGYIYPPNGNIRIGLSRKDHGHIEKFKSCIGSSSPVRKIMTSNKYEASQIDIYGAYECQTALENHFNISQAKSHTLQPPNLQKREHIQHFIRGYMDGDGSISYSGSGRNNHWTLSFVGTKEILTWIKQQVQEYVTDVGDPSVVSCSNTYQLIFGGWQVRPILKWLYYDSTVDIYLDRKRDKYVEVLKFYPLQKRQYSSKYKGVTYYKRTGKWMAEIKHNNKRYHLGTFKTDWAAALAYNTKAKELGLEDRCYQVEWPTKLVSNPGVDLKNYE